MREDEGSHQKAEEFRINSEKHLQEEIFREEATRRLEEARQQARAEREKVTAGLSHHMTNGRA